jgi:sensor c-di-GMP phosphodiesterase-like protein
MRAEMPRILVLYGLAAIAVIMPLAAASWLAEHESLLREEDRADAIASALLQRTERITEQLRRVFNELSHSPPGDRCDDQELASLRALVIKSNLLIDVGFVQADELLCSAFGRTPVPIGPPTYSGHHGYIVRVGVRHPLAPEAQLIIVTDQKTGYAGMVSQALVIDDVPEEHNLAAGMIAVQSSKVLAQRGTFNPDWLRRIGDAHGMTFYDGTNVVAWRRSDRTDYAAFVAIGRPRI